MKNKREELIEIIYKGEPTADSELIDAILAWHKEKIRPIAEKIWHETMNECTKTMGSISLSKYKEPYKMKNFEELFKEVCE
jgi:hypothetical protein